MTLVRNSQWDRLRMAGFAGLTLLLVLLSGIARAESSPAAWAFDLLKQVDQWQTRDPLDFLPGATNTLSSVPADNLTARRRIESHQRLTPIYFEPNVGQTAEDVKFLARGPGYTLFLTANETVLALQGKAVIRTQLEGETRNPEPQMEGLEKLPGISNYFLGNDPAKWRTQVPHYQQVRYAGVYPGIDLVYYGNPNQLEHDFIVAPGVDPSVIQLAISGAERVRINAEGDLVLTVPGGEVVQQAPRIYQVINGRQEAVAGRYVLRNEDLADTGTARVAVTDPVAEALRVGFEVAQYDREQPLVIDPVLDLAYSTFLGGIKVDYATSIAVDQNSYAYVTGATASPIDFPVVGGTGSSSFENKGLDAFVSSFDFNSPGSSSLRFSTYLGGADDEDDIGYDIVLDISGTAVYVTGTTESENSFNGFPVSGGAAHNGGKDAFITVLEPLTGAIYFSTCWGGTGDDEGRGIAVDRSGDIYITGFTKSDFTNSFPGLDPVTDPSTTFQPFQPALLGGIDAFISKTDLSGSRLYSTYLGGAKDDKGAAIVVDNLGGVYITGSTKSSNFPVTGLSFDTTLGGSEDGFIAKLDPMLGRYALIYSSYVGGTSTDSGAGIAVDSTYKAYITGTTASSNFPVTSAVAQSRYGGNVDAFIAKIDPDPTLTGMNSLLYSTYLGGSGRDEGSDIVVTEDSSSGQTRTYISVTGATASSNFPVTSDALDSTLGGAKDAFVAQISSTNDQWLYVTYLGGNNGDDSGAGIAADTTGSGANVYIVGATAANDFPFTSNAFYTINNNVQDAFVVKLAESATYSLTVNRVGSGTVTSSPAGIICGVVGADCTETYLSGKTITLTAAPAIGSMFSGWGGACSGLGTTCSVVMDAAKTVDATFTSQTYIVSATAGANGSITPVTRAVSQGTTTTFTVMPDIGYVASVTGCNGTLSGATYTTGSITGSCTVTASFNRVGSGSYIVTATAEANGSITPVTRTVASGATTTFTVIPDTDYTATVTGCGGTLSGATYTTGPISSLCTVTARFTQTNPISYTVSATAGANGSITPTTRTVVQGATTTFTVTPNTGYVATASGCSGALSGTTYTTGPITGACTVIASFSPMGSGSYTVTATAGSNGSITPTTRTVSLGATTTFTVLADSGYASAVSGCNGTLAGNTFTTGPITGACTVNAIFSLSNSTTTLITHYYTSILNRASEVEGLNYWQQRIAESQARGEDAKPIFREMADFFFNSLEYVGNNTSDNQFITDLYRTFFQREPDQAGMNFWLGQLAAGVSRQNVMAGFLYSPEFTAFMQGLGF